MKWAVVYSVSPLSLILEVRSGGWVQSWCLGWSVTWECVALTHNGLIVFFNNLHRRIYLLILEKREEGRERGKESERNSDVREKYQLVPSRTHPDRKWNLQPSQVCALTRDRTLNILVYGMTLQPSGPLGQGSLVYLLWQVFMQMANCHY